MRPMLMSAICTLNMEQLVHSKLQRGFARAIIIIKVHRRNYPFCCDPEDLARSKACG